MSCQPTAFPKGPVSWSDYAAFFFSVASITVRRHTSPRRSGGVHAAWMRKTHTSGATAMSTGGSVYLLWIFEHFLASCPVKAYGTPVTRSRVESTHSNCKFHSLTDIQLVSPVTVSDKVLIDSGADKNFIDWNLAKKLKLTVFPLPFPLAASALDGRFSYWVSHRTQPVHIIMVNGLTTELSSVFFSPSLAHLGSSLAIKACSTY